MARSGSKRLFITGWRKVRGAGGQRLAVTALMLIAALLLARFSWVIPFTDNAERGLYDFRTYTLAEKVDQDDRLVVAVYTDQTLIDLRKRSPLDRGLLADALRNIDAMGAKAIGIDMLFDQPQDEDEDLIDALRSMRTPTLVAYAETESNESDIIYEQQLFLDDFMARLEGSNARPASIRLSAGRGTSDGVTRLWPEIIEGLPQLLGRAMIEAADEGVSTFPGYDGALRYQLPAQTDVPVYTSLQIDLFANPDIAPGLAPFVAGRYVLIGGDIVDYDRVETPFSGFINNAAEAGGLDRFPPGIEAHAATISQMLDGARMKTAPNWAVWVIAMLVVIAASLTALLELKSWKFVPFVIVELAMLLGLPFWLHAQGVDTYGFPAIGPALGWVLAFTAITGAARASTAVERKFAQGALGKYLPREMADQIIENPDLLALHGEKREICVLFSDLEGFTKMSHAIPPEMVAKLLNRYLEMLSQVVLDHGGVIDKFVGDAVVAFWGAPIAKPDDATRAAKAGYAIWQAGEDFRAEVAAMDSTLPKVGKTRVGLHFGEAVVGNFGGDTRIQYTALGDSMNTAARLESANKALKTSVMASRELAQRSGLDWWRQMGAVVLSGRSSAIDLFEPAPDFPAEDRAALAQAVDLLASDSALAQEKLAAIAAKYPDDEGLQMLVIRSGDINEAGAHVLSGK